MTRQETIDKYIDAFLKGRSRETQEKFRAKAEHLQYASIMQWRRRMRKIENTPKSTREIIDTLRRVGSLIENAPEIADDDIHTIYTELDALREVLTQYDLRQRQRHIDELEMQQRSISAKLEQLRNR